MNSDRIDFGNIDWESPVPGLRFKAYIRDGIKVRLVEISGEHVEKDWCRKGHIGYMLHGSMTVEFSEKTMVFQEGDGLFISEGEENRHRAVVASGEKALMVFFEKA